MYFSNTVALVERIPEYIHNCYTCYLVWLLYNIDEILNNVS
jgi:hypothetical protein